MSWLVLGAAAVLVVLIGLIAIGRVTAQLATRPATSVYDIVAATEHIAERLPDRVAGRLSADDVEAVLYWHLEYLRQRGLASFGGVDELAGQAKRRAEARRADQVADEDEAVDVVLARATRSGRDIDDVDVVVVLDLEADYLRSIAAVGPEAASDADPETS